jgi:hypothetical protein
MMFYAQAVCGLSPTRSALLIAPMAIASGVLAPFVGMIIDRFPPLPVLGFGFSMLAIGLTWLSFEMAPGTPIWRLALAFGAIGVGMAFVWSPLTATATRNLPPHLAGASSGVYNTTRQLGAVLGSAGMAAFMTSSIGAQMPALPRGGHTPIGVSTLKMPGFLREPFAAAMSQSILLPAFVALFGVIAALFLVNVIGSATTREGGSDAEDAEDDDGYDGYDGNDDDDDYVEYILRREPDTKEPARDTEPLQAGAWHSVPDERVRMPRAAPIGFARNGFHVDEGRRRLRPVAQFSRPALRPARRQTGSEGTHAPLAGAEPPRNTHYRADPEDPAPGRHSS